jgi:signal peptidase I
VKAFLREFLAILVLAIVIFFLIQATFPSYYVEFSSMEPNIHPGQRLVINKVVYNLHEPERGDIIVFSNPINPEGKDYIKRIIALPGETIEIKAGIVYINGLKLDEPYIEDLSSRSFQEQKMPENEYFVLGDNRNNSDDSRTGWTVPRQDIIGKAWLSTWPPSAWGLVPNYSPVSITTRAMSSYLLLSGVDLWG